jgi:hypothetical protein
MWSTVVCKLDTGTMASGSDVAHRDAPVAVGDGSRGPYNRDGGKPAACQTRRPRDLKSCSLSVRHRHGDGCVAFNGRRLPVYLHPYGAPV